MTIRKPQRGISLLEVMLVIAVSAVIVIYIASFIKNRTSQAAIQQTSSDMQRWLQASSSFYVHNKRWPENLEVLVNAGYMTQEAKCSPWHVAGGDPGCMGRAQYQPIAAPSRYWGIQVTTPNAKNALQLATVLPGAAVLDNNSVAAYVPLPTMPIDLGPVLAIKGIFTLQVGTDDTTGKVGALVNKSQCPPGWRWGYDLALNTFFQDHGASMINSIGVIKDKDADDNSKPGYAFVFEDMVGVDTHHGSATVITYCIPPGYSGPP